MHNAILAVLVLVRARCTAGASLRPPALLPPRALSLSTHPQTERIARDKEQKAARTQQAEAARAAAAQSSGLQATLAAEKAARAEEQASGGDAHAERLRLALREQRDEAERELAKEQVGGSLVHELVTLAIVAL